MSAHAAPAPPAASADAPASPWRRARARLVRDRLAMASLAVLALLVSVAVLGKVLTEWLGIVDPAAVRLTDRLLPPLSGPSDLVAGEMRPALGVYLLGTDDLGRDLFARMLQGTFVSLSVGFVAVGIATVIGVLLGAVAGYQRERRILGVSLDSIIMRSTDVVLAFPAFFLILTVVALLPPSIYNIMVVIGLTSWMATARFVRAEFLSMREQQFVDAARALGLPGRRVMFRHMLPNALAPVLVTAIISVAYAILTESALSFLGFGVQPPDATWGNILADGRAFLFDAPWLFFIPGTAILVVVLAFNLVGEGLREALNPRSMSIAAPTPPEEAGHEHDRHA